MMTQQSFSLRMMVKRKKRGKNGLAPIYVIIRLEGEEEEEKTASIIPHELQRLIKYCFLTKRQG